MSRSTSSVPAGRVEYATAHVRRRRWFGGTTTEPVRMPVLARAPGWLRVIPGEPDPFALVLAPLRLVLLVALWLTASPPRLAFALFAGLALAGHLAR